MSAELPVWGWYGDRRAFLVGLARVTAGTEAAIYLAPLIAGCDLPMTGFDDDTIRWNLEYEEDTVYFFAQNLTAPKDMFFAHLGREKLAIYALYEGETVVEEVFVGEHCQVLDEQWVREFLSNSDVARARGFCGRLFPIVRGLVVEAIANEGPKVPDLSFQTIRDATLVLGDDFPLVAKGKRYAANPDSAQIFEAPKITGIPRQFVEQIPESENKFNFRQGDILADSRGKGWFLQNGGRYEIRGGTRNFMENRHKKMRVFEVPNWAIDKVPKRDLPSRFFKDQHGRQIDGESDRLLVLWGGMGSTSESTMKDFEPLANAFLKNGGREGEILFGTPNMRPAGGSFSPEHYDKSHSLAYPPSVIEGGKNFYKWLKISAPLAQVVSCGHSQGGVVAFYAGHAHPDMHCRVITINSPLVGIDRRFVSIGPFEFEDLAFFNGCESWPLDDMCEPIRHYVAEGDSPTLRDNVETWAKLISDNGVGVINFSARQDPIVGPSHAILKNSTKVLGGRAVRELWDIPGDMFGSRSPHGRILSHKPFIEEALFAIAA